MEFQDTSSIEKYHAHVYFDETTVEQAQSLCEEAGRRFSVIVGRVHRKKVGPHPSWSCQLAFDRSNHTDLLTWLALNRDSLTILIHPLSGNDLLDHTDYYLTYKINNKQQQQRRIFFTLSKVTITQTFSLLNEYCTV